MRFAPERDTQKRRRPIVRVAALALVPALFLVAGTRVAWAQDLEPRAYAANPVGVAFLTAGFVRSTGAVVTDPTVPLSDISASINSVLAGGGYTFDLFGKVGQVFYAMPYAWGRISGQVYESAQSIDKSGLTDSRMRVAVNIIGNDAMGAREFARAPRRPILGASLTMSAPSGQYYPDRIINLGANRWGFKPEIGLSIPKGRWDFDAYLGTWLFAANDDYFPGGRRREQKSIGTVQAHVAYTFRPRLWMAGDATWYAGGETQVAGSTPGTGVSNTRLGLTLSVPVGARQSLKFAYNTGASVRTGTNFSTFSAAWMRLWLTKM